MPEAEALAKKIIAHPSIGVTLAKLAIHKAWVLPLEDGLDLERTYGALAMQTEETRSFTQDFLAKKKYAKGK
jgi:enoyl-CoA hydratase/carnithine racemase